MEPNIERLKLWVDDLRTTKVEQAKGALETTDGKNCCLGRACRVAMKNGLGLETLQVNAEDENDEEFLVVQFDQTYLSLPYSVMEWYGLSSSDPCLISADKFDINPTASGLNDTLEYTFAQIADCIERTWPETKN